MNVKVFLSGFAAACAMTVGAMEYFVDSSAGDDTRDGLSAANAWRSLERVNGADFAPGDVVRFKRGGLWRGTLVPRSGEPGRPIVYTTYGIGQKPILQNSVDRSRPEDWFEESPGLWSTRRSDPVLGEQVWRTHEGEKWNVTFQQGMKGTARLLTENGETFYRVTCTQQGPQRSPHLIQVWGPQFKDLPRTAVMRFKVRASAPMNLKNVHVIKEVRPYTHSHVTEMKFCPVGSEWTAVEASLVQSAHLSEMPRFHLAIGDELSVGASFDVQVVGIWRAEIDYSAQIPQDVGIFIVNHGEKWGVKKWNNPEWEVPQKEPWISSVKMENDLDYWYDSANRRVLVRYPTNPGAAFKSIELAMTKHVVSENGCHDVTYDGLWVRYGAAHGFGGGGTKNITIRNCDICWIGGGLQFWRRHEKTGKIVYPVRYGNGIEFWGTCDNNLVERCRLWEIYDAAVTNQGKDDDETNVTWRDNVIWNSEYSFEYWNARMTKNVIFAHNTCVDAGVCWSHAQRPNPNGAHLMYYSNRAKTENFVVRDNIFCRATEWTARSGLDWRQSLRHDHNLIWNDGKDVPVMRWLDGKHLKILDWSGYRQLGFDPNGQFAEPLFRDPAKRDYRLRPGSPGLTLASDGTAVGARNMPGLDEDQSLFRPLEPSPLFSDHAVLLKSADTPVFGFATPGTEVKVSLGGVSATCTTGADSRWLARLDLRNVGEGPFELRINGFVAKDVLVGEVWLASGQSNMSFSMQSADDMEAEAKTVNPKLRCFLVRSRYAASPIDRIDGSWYLTEPNSTPRLSAVAWHFAKNLQERLQTPVAFVQSAVGASAIEAWCEPESMKADADARKEFGDRIAFMNGYRAYEAECEAKLRDWERRWKRSDRPTAGVPSEGWRAFAAKELETFGHAPGAVWFRRTVPAGRGFVFRRNRFIEKQWSFDTSSVTVYWNGVAVPRRFSADPTEKNTEEYVIPADAKEGVLAVRVFNSYSIIDVPHSFCIGGRRIDRKDWQVAVEFKLPYASREAVAEMPERQLHCLRQHYPTGLYNGMVAGLVPMGLSGVIWYQGESNALRSEAYAKLFPALIRSWRDLFRKPELPFAWCQLASYRTKETDPNVKDVSWPLLRETQTKTLALPKTGQAVLLDAGEEQDIHPRDKRTPGKRLAAWALNTVYGFTDTPYLGPRATGVAAEGADAVVTFADCAQGLTAHDLGETYPKRTSVNSYGKVVRNSPAAQVEGFSVAGADGVWHWADKADIAGKTVRVSSAKVAKPVRVRYGWSQDPWVNLYNTDGFPALPFELEVR